MLEVLVVTVVVDDVVTVAVAPAAVVSVMVEPSIDFTVPLAAAKLLAPRRSHRRGHRDRRIHRRRRIGRHQARRSWRSRRCR